MGNTANLVSYWLLDTNSFTTPDGWGSNTLTKNSTVNSVAGVFGNASSYGPSDNNSYWKITDAAQSGLDITGDITMGAWVYTQTYNNDHVVMGKIREAYTYRMVTTTGTLIGRYNATAASASTSAVTLSTWVHTAVVLDTVADTVKYYFDGVLDTTITSFTAIPTNTANDFTIGAGDADYYNMGIEATAGLMDEPFIFARTLTGAEILDIKQNGMAAFATTSATTKFCRMMLLGVQ